MTNQNVEQWDIFEITLPEPAAGNPFIDVQLSAAVCLRSARFRARWLL